jgi:broad specificity phosphatase PhoE|tara:strand:+ start:6422 stop:7051 length:630 start_codon:yes stop_codon:yes gene_type:complete
MVPADQPVLLLIRHSLREEADNLMPGFAVPLTAEGVTMARQWGSEIRLELQAVHSSQWPRCVDTAEAMIAGAGADGSVTIEDKLCEPGCYVTEMKLAGPAFVRLGPIEFISRLLQSEDLSGTNTTREGSAELMSWLRSRQPERGKINLFVTHDTILAGFVYDLLGKQHLTSEDWPWMLEGVFLWFDTAFIHWVWRGERGKKPLAEYELA